MKKLDKLLRAWRTRIALDAAPKNPEAVLDIGCGDGHLLRSLSAPRRDGLDPELSSASDANGLRLCRGRFPDDLDALSPAGPYDAIFALAVFEHLTESELQRCREVIPGLLGAGGRLIISVPHPAVDWILAALIFLNLIDGLATHEHHGLDPNLLTQLASERLALVSRTRFQLGLNNLFVFERI